MITFLAILLLVVSIWHLIAENVIGPSMRMMLRNRLFACRDRLRRARSEDPRLTAEAYAVLEDGLNANLISLSGIRLSALHRMKNEIKTDAKIREIIEHRQRVVATVADLPDVKEIEREWDRVLILAVSANAMGWMIYVVPPLMVAAVLFRVFRWVGAKQRANLRCLRERDAKSLLRLDQQDPGVQFAC